MLLNYENALTSLVSATDRAITPISLLFNLLFHSFCNSGKFLQKVFKDKQHKNTQDIGCQNQTVFESPGLWGWEVWSSSQSCIYTNNRDNANTYGT